MSRLLVLGRFGGRKVHIFQSADREDPTASSTVSLEPSFKDKKLEFHNVPRDPNPADLFTKPKMIREMNLNGKLSRDAVWLVQRRGRHSADMEHDGDLL